MTSRTRSAGFALVLALFLIVSLAAIAGYMLTISTGQVAAATQDEQAARAYQAARAGIEWGAYRLLRDPAAAYANPCAAGAQPPKNINLINGLAGFFAKVECQLAGAETEGGTNVRVFTLTSTGCNQAGCPGPGAATYVERQLQLTLTTAN